MRDALDKIWNVRFNPVRRRFGKLTLAGALGGRIILSHACTSAAAKKNTSNIKFSVQISSALDDEQLAFVRQLGVEYVTIWVGGESATYENFLRMRRKVETAGLKLLYVGNVRNHDFDAVTLNLPGRDERIEEYKNYIRNLGKAGLHYATYGHKHNGNWMTESEKTRGGARSRAFDVEKAANPDNIRIYPGNLSFLDKGKLKPGIKFVSLEKGRKAWKRYVGPLTHGRYYSEEEIWDNYTYFIKAVVPVAEEYGVRIGIHPDDPPLPLLGGIPRCIFSSFDGYKRALEIADSDNVGICLCVGCWLEGGELMGKDVLDTIRYFGKRGKIFKVHFRNVSAPLPHFIETFVDDGYMDMYRVMKALREVDFDGVMIDDHVPNMAGGGWVGNAFSFGYMRALLERANEEVGG